MARTIVDDDLRSWEAFASTGRYGFAPGSRLIFSCTTDPDERPRAYVVRGDKSDAESLLAGASRAELTELFAGAAPLE